MFVEVTVCLSRWQWLWGVHETRWQWLWGVHETRWQWLWGGPRDWHFVEVTVTVRGSTRLAFCRGDSDCEGSTRLAFCRGDSDCEGFTRLAFCQYTIFRTTRKSTKTTYLHATHSEPFIYFNRCCLKPAEFLII